MKEPRTILEWEALSKEEKRTALQTFPCLEGKVQRAYKWINRAKEWELEAAELFITNGVIETIEVAALNASGADIYHDMHDALYKRTVGYMQNDAEYWTPDRIANACQNMREIISQIKRSRKDGMII